MIDALPPLASFDQHFHPSRQNWLPFHWREFLQTSRVTYVLPSLDNPTGVWENLRSNTRQNIRKAERSTTLDPSPKLEDFIALNQTTFSRQGESMHVPVKTIQRVDEACAARGCRRVFLARDSARHPHAACYLVWDHASAYYLMGGSDPSFRGSGAFSLVLWKSIQFAASLPGARSFDFEGSMVEPIERFVRAWGGRQTPYHAISKTPSRALRVYRGMVRSARSLQSTVRSRLSTR